MQVSLAEALSSKLREAQSPDENSEFQMMMLNMGISNPVTKYSLKLCIDINCYLQRNSRKFVSFGAGKTIVGFS
jgi:hypothetical protein